MNGDALVSARRRWVDTEIDLVAGVKYQFTASGRWWDFSIKSGPAGRDLRGRLSNLWMRRYEGRRRVPKAHWMELIGALDQDIATAFRIGAGCPWTPQQSGRLYCFANDLPKWYWNNHGRIHLQVEVLDE